MFSQELWLENEKKCAVVRKPKPGRKRQELLAVAWGVKVGVKGGFLWPPLKLFACPQISSLVRRAALTHNDNHFNYEKTHNFKVSQPLPSFFCSERARDQDSVCFHLVSDAKVTRRLPLAPRM